jgi:hypothetical protein
MITTHWQHKVILLQLYKIQMNINRLKVLQILTIQKFLAASGNWHGALLVTFACLFHTLHVILIYIYIY